MSKSPLHNIMMTPVDTKPGEESEPMGLGDMVAKVIKTASGGKIKPCEGCKKRQASLNNLTPWTRRSKK